MCESPGLEWTDGDYSVVVGRPNIATAGRYGKGEGQKVGIE